MALNGGLKGGVACLSEGAASVKNARPGEKLHQNATAWAVVFPSPLLAPSPAEPKPPASHPGPVAELEGKPSGGEGRRRCSKGRQGAEPAKGGWPRRR